MIRSLYKQVKVISAQVTHKPNPPPPKKNQFQSVSRFMTGPKPSKLSVRATCIGSCIPTIKWKDVQSGHFWDMNSGTFSCTLTQNLGTDWCIVNQQHSAASHVYCVTLFNKTKLDLLLFPSFLSGHSIFQLYTLKFPVIWRLVFNPLKPKDLKKKVVLHS